jgi:subtilisin family serine protease
LTLVVPAIAADPTPSASAPTEPIAPPAAEPTPTPTPEPTPVEPVASAVPDPAPVEPPPAEPTPEPAPEATPAPEPTAKPAAGEPTTDAAGRPNADGRYIVLLSPTADTTGVVTRHAKREGIKADRKFERGIRAFAAKLDAGQRRALLDDPSVVAVVPDEVIGITAQINPTGVSRIGARLSATAAIDGIDDRVDADVAIVDTGIAYHPDLNVVGGVNCSTSDRSAWQDANGHGTHVAGTVAALDNDLGVVGVAPGARLWAVRILNSEGYGLLSWYVCGLDWILAQRDPVDSSRPLIESVNMSVAKSGSDDLNCGITNKDVLHQAICRLYAGGITVVAAAANDHTSAANSVPAAYNEVITVSALADTDGRAGGLGGPRCYSWGTYDVDDTFADFSNYGSDVDVIAPGKCIYSTVPGSYGYSSGTSMAAPAVTGAVALYKSSRPSATPAEVREALRYLGNFNWATSTDPDSTHEPLLDVSRVAALGTFSLNAPTAAARVASNGGTVTIPVTLNRSGSFFERVRLSLSGVPSGWSATLSATSLLGWTVNGATATIAVPQTTKPGSYDLQVVATNWGRTDTATITVQVAGDAPVASPPIAAVQTATTTGLLTSVVPTITARVSWPAATDPSDPIVAYQVQHSANGGAWRTISTAGTVRTASFSGLAAGASHRFQVRAQDRDGFWSAWAMNPTPYYISSINDRSTVLTYRGTWRKVASSSAIGRIITTSTARGAYVTHQFTGRAAAIVAPTSPTRGKAEVWVDGRLRATIDLRTSTSRARRVVYAISYGAIGTHTIQLRVLGTAGRPTVSLDGLVILR